MLTEYDKKFIERIIEEKLNDLLFYLSNVEFTKEYWADANVPDVDELDEVIKK